MTHTDTSLGQSRAEALFARDPTARSLAIELDVVAPKVVPAFACG